MAIYTIEMDRGNGWEVRAQDELPVTADDLRDMLLQIKMELTRYAIQYPHRALADGVELARAQPGRRR